MRAISTIIFLGLIASCSHRKLDRVLADPSLDGLRHESLARYTDQDLSKLKGFAQGIAMCHQGRHGEALKLFKDSLDQNINNPVYWNHLGTCYYLKGEYPKSLVYLDISSGLAAKAKRNNALASVLNNQGLNYLKLESWPEAMDAFKKSMKLNPRSMTPKYNLAQLYLAKGLYNNAKTLLEELHQIAPQDVDVLYSLGHLNLMKNQFQKALNYFQRIPDAYLRRDDVAVNLATTYYLMGQGELALKTLNKAPMKAPQFTLQQTELKKRIERNLNP